MTANVIRIPCETESAYMARTILRNPGAYTKDQVLAAIEVLAESNEWFDIRQVSEARNLLWAVPGSEILTGDNFRRLTDEELYAAGIATCLFTRPDDVPDFATYDLRVVLIGAAVAVWAGVAIGYAAQWLWGAV